MASHLCFSGQSEKPRNHETTKGSSPMQQVKQPKPPPELGCEGKKLWRAIVADAAGQGIELTAAELVYLRQAGKLADSIALMEAAMAGAELVVPGYMNKGL